MKRGFFILIAFLLFTANINAQNRPARAFDPNKFQAELEQFITREACLTPQEAAKFFPVFRELGKKQRALFEKIPHNRHIKPANEAGCREAIIERDEKDLQVKMLQQQYHLKFMEILSAQKVYDVIRAEEKFHRQAFRQMAGWNRR
ncbi:MAG: hypothetical protein K5893_03225 [Prevotella sp.]|nr:hypothetical protein [Prevotella sp.]